MLSKIFRHAVLASSIFHGLSGAQSQSNIIPQDLQAGFARSSDELQVSYTGDAVNGFADGTVFEKDAVAKLPEFALGDAAGISSQRRYTVIMLDTTCASSPRLHYARANFRYNFEIVKIESQTTPALAYQAPGAFGETGDQRQYSFLMYNQPGFRDLTDLKVPGDGQAFDAEKFKSDNGLADPVAGVGMVVKLSGETSCDGQTVPPPSNGGNAPPAAPSAAPPAPSAPPAQGPTSSAGGARPQPTPAPAPAPGSPEPSAAPTSTSAVRQTPAVPSPSPASSPSAAQSTATSQSTGDEEQAASTSAPASSGTSRARPIATITSTVLGDVPSTLVPSAPGAAETASGTVSGPPVVQTDSAASELEVKLAGAVVLGSAVVFAGLLVW